MANGNNRWLVAGGNYPRRESILIMSDQPEWHAVNNTVRVNQGLPEIDVNNPIYQYQRSDNTIKLLRALE